MINGLFMEQIRSASILPSTPLPIGRKTYQLTVFHLVCAQFKGSFLKKWLDPLASGW